MAAPPPTPHSDSATLNSHDYALPSPTNTEISASDVRQSLPIRGQIGSSGFSELSNSWTAGQHRVYSHNAYSANAELERRGRQLQSHGRNHFAPHSPYSYVYSTDLERTRMSVLGVAAAPKHENASIQPRQIRFVPNDGLPHAKRRRITAACQTCRRRKTRCSGERPICKTCSDNGHECMGYTGPLNQKQRPSVDQNAEDDEDLSSPTNLTAPEVLASQSVPRGQGSPAMSSKSHSSGRSIKSNSASPMTTRIAPIAFHKQEPELADGRSPASNGTNQSISHRNTVPYFRYFGPTAIAPGFKQMVVSMKGPRVPHSDRPASSESSVSNLAGQLPSTFRATPSASGSEPRATPEIPFYHANDPGPVPALVRELCELFFHHLGCNYPFLQRNRFLRDLEEKSVDAILVDAVCALAARFSNHPLLTTPNDQSVEVDANNEVQRAFRGHQFAQRAMASVIDTFAYPTVAVVQACLLLAYDEFGSNHDSGLWMYLGTSIRMAQDIGMHKLEGLRLEGRVGPTPKTAKRGSAGSNEETEREETQKAMYRKEEELLRKELASESGGEIVTIEDRRENERERIDTFYSVFFLDRVVSSGTGRPVTLRDKDIEISFPYRSDDEAIDGWPAPFPPLIRIIHLYGRAADVLNGIKDVNQVTPDTLKRLAGMEKDLTGIYQSLSLKLHFNAVNFQHYVKAEQGTNFILLHFWFHTLIVLLHQPTLLHSFSGKIQQLFPDSRELSMSSAKTIADILAFAELIDAKSFIGNPFTTQPMYIAACAFLAEIARYSSRPSTRGSSPTDEPSTKAAKTEGKDQGGTSKSKSNKSKATKHNLLATAANQNYHQCYKALKAVENYWAGTRYILTALDQKAKGIMDPLLYTNEDIESAIEVPRQIPVYSTPGWRRSLAHSHSFSYPSRPRLGSNNSKLEAWSPNMDPNQAIGWSLTGTMNSPNPSLSFLYSTTNPELAQHGPIQPTQLPSTDQHKSGLIPNSGSLYQVPSQQGMTGNVSNMLPPQRYPSHRQRDQISETDLLLGLQSPTASTSAVSRPSPSNHLNYDQAQYLHASQHIPQPGDQLNSNLNSHQSNALDHSLHHNLNINSPFNDMMMVESQDIDVHGPQAGFAFPTGDMIPWLEYLPQGVLNYFEDVQENQSQDHHEQPGSSGSGAPHGPSGSITGHGHTGGPGA